MTDVYIGIGANLGHRKTNMEKAIQALSDLLFDIECSQFYKTDPMDYLDQDFFLNRVVKGQTDLPPNELLTQIHLIEKWGGRQRNKKIPKGPRTIDLDILLYGDQIIESEVLTIPHPSMIRRKFVLIPLLELNSTLIDPLSGDFFYHHLEKIENQGVYCYSLNGYNNLFL